jgi:glycerol-3-phosphate dehydrogenase
MESFVSDVQDRWPFLGASLAWRLASAYGTRIALLLGDIESCRDMGEDFGGGLTRLEVDFLMGEEWATSVEDLYWRHSKAGLYASPADERRLAAYIKSKSDGKAVGHALRTG